MKIEQLNANAKVRRIDDTMVELGLPELAPTALYPGQVSKIRTGVKLTLESGETAAIVFTQLLSEAGVTLAYPTLISESTPAELILSVFNRSAFVQMLEPDKTLCAIVTISRGAKIVSEAKRLLASAKMPEAAQTPPPAGGAVKQASGAIGTAQRLIRKTLGRKEPADAA